MYVTDVSQYLPKLEVVLQPVQNHWEQLGVSLGIDQSVLSSIKSTPGDSTMYMRQLLEKWSAEGGQLKEIEEGLTSIEKKDLISGIFLKRIIVIYRCRKFTKNLLKVVLRHT